MQISKYHAILSAHNMHDAINHVTSKDSLERLYFESGNLNNKTTMLDALKLPLNGTEKKKSSSIGLVIVIKFKLRDARWGDEDSCVQSSDM